MSCNAPKEACCCDPQKCVKASKDEVADGGRAELRLDVLGRLSFVLFCVEDECCFKMERERHSGC